MGIAMREAKMLEVSDTVQSYTTVLENHVSSKTQMVLCVLSSEKKDLYDGIKQYLCVNCLTPSQCVVARTLDKPQTLMTIVTKIAQQMNCKMGGALRKVETGLQNAMFISIDCFHDIVNRRKSVAGFVSSINQELTQWFSQCIFQESGQELVNGLKTCLEGSAMETTQPEPSRKPGDTCPGMQIRLLNICCSLQVELSLEPSKGSAVNITQPEPRGQPGDTCPATQTKILPIFRYRKVQPTDQSPEGSSNNEMSTALPMSINVLGSVVETTRETCGQVFDTYPVKQSKLLNIFRRRKFQEP
ncbi:piwi-like protein 1 isoform X4 [Canis lupus familiaris]|uniref:piwi-like protein 1 isoform X4 n=1 Tax=Canis lupus familiaris TaxID=9615 RepID=UPI0018F5C995|nr:piwi-like protein 1 isoform X4 [Canis lupus familiaris]